MCLTSMSQEWRGWAAGAVALAVAACGGETSPTQPAARPFAKMSAGGAGTCGVTAGGAAYCWGSNFSGQLGDGTTTDRSSPVLVAGGVSFAAVGSGYAHNCGVTPGGAAYCWGLNSSGELGDGTTTDRSSPVLVTGSVSFAAVRAAGNAFTCGVTSGGAAYCWGNNIYGQLGDGTTTNRSSPVLVTGGVSFAAVSAGGDGGHTCGVPAGGAAYCWGYNGSGQLGDGTTTNRSSPVLVTGGVSFAAVSAGPGGDFTCGVTSGGAVYCWGYNGNGELGDGTTTNRSSPVLVMGGVSFAAVSAGGAHTCGVTSGGAAYCWGWNAYGQLGDGTTTNRSSPVLVTGGVSFAAVSAGSAHSCGLTSGGAVYCWGLNSTGQLGDGTTTDRSSPVLVVQ